MAEEILRESYVRGEIDRNQFIVTLADVRPGESARDLTLSDNEIEATRQNF
jgi:hypothetical protein